MGTDPNKVGGIPSVLLPWHGRPLPSTVSFGSSDPRISGPPHLPQAILTSKPAQKLSAHPSPGTKDRTRYIGVHGPSPRWVRRYKDALAFMHRPGYAKIYQRHQHQEDDRVAPHHAHQPRRRQLVVNPAWREQDGQGTGPHTPWRRFEDVARRDARMSWQIKSKQRRTTK